MYLLSVQKQEDFETRLCLLPEHRAAELSSFTFRSFSYVYLKCDLYLFVQGAGGRKRPERELGSVLRE